MNGLEGGVGGCYCFSEELGLGGGVEGSIGLLSEEGRVSDSSRWSGI